MPPNQQQIRNKSTLLVWNYCNILVRRRILEARKRSLFLNLEVFRQLDRFLQPFGVGNVPRRRFWKKLLNTSFSLCFFNRWANNTIKLLRMGGQSNRGENLRFPNLDPYYIYLINVAGVPSWEGRNASAFIYQRK